MFVWLVCLFFFFQAEDGIRDGTVTGVQTCALPIWCIQTRLTQTRAVSGLAGSTIARAISRRPLPVENGLGFCPEVTERNRRGTSSPGFAGFPRRKMRDRKSVV